MTEVETSLIAQNLQFKKIYRMPKSCWAQLRDRVINVPVPAMNITNTIQQLPRNPSDSGLIGVNWKRKVSYKNTHIQIFRNTFNILLDSYQSTHFSNCYRVICDCNVM